MALALNEVTLLGRLTKDVEVRKTASGLSVAQFSVAVPRKTKSANGTQETDFINCVAWRQSADYLAQYAHKGDQVLVKGRIQVRAYTTQDGQNRQAFEVIAEEVSSQAKVGASTGATQNAGGYQQSASQQQNNNFNSYEPEQTFTGDVSDDNLYF